MKLFHHHSAAPAAQPRLNIVAAAVLVSMSFAGSAWSATCVPVAGADPATVTAPPAAVKVAVGGNAQNPTDISSYIANNQNIELQGGQYVVRVPVATANGKTVGQLVTELKAKKDSNAQISTAFVMSSTPLIDYTGVISGSGTVLVTNQTSTAARADLQVDGGALAMHCRQTLRNADSSPVFIVDRNTAIEFVESFAYLQDSKTLQFAYVQGNAFDYDEANIVSNGMFHSHVGYRWGDITGVGSAGFAHDYSWREDLLVSGHKYNGKVFIGYGLHVATNAKLDPKLQLWQQGILSFETQGGSLVKGQAAPHIDTFTGTYWNAGPDTQIQRGGVQQFTGESFLISGVKDPTTLAPDDARKLGCMRGFGQQKGRTFYNMGTMLLGDGSPIVTYPDGSTSFFMNGHPYDQNAWIIVGQFASNPPKTLADAAHSHAVALNYSGTYPVNINFNTDHDGLNVTGQHDKAWGNLIVMNPDPGNTGKAVNHPVVTVPVMMQGIVQIEKNAVLELGDGTAGNEFDKTVVVGSSTGPQTFKGTCNTSNGNGMVITKGNRPNTAKLSPADVFQITNDGKLIVNNTPNALSVTRMALPELVSWMSSNTLDGIVGSGSVEQAGKLPLTLGAASGNPNTYTGGTLVRTGATLIVGHATALGSAAAGVPDSGKVVNQGTLKASAGVRTIHVSGDYLQ